MIPGDRVYIRDDHPMKPSAIGTVARVSSPGLPINGKILRVVWVELDGESERQPFPVMDEDVTPLPFKDAS